MKISAKQYAQALYELVQGKSQSEIDQVVADFVKLLERNRQMKNAEMIMDKFKAIWNGQNGIVEAEVSSSHKLEADSLKEITRFIKDKYQAREVFLKNEIDENLVGGVSIRIGDEVIDASIRNSLDSLKKNLISN